MTVRVCLGPDLETDAVGQRHQFTMASEAEGNALCDTLNANCVAIAHAQKAADSQKLIVLCATLHGTELDFADAKAAVRPFALATRDEVGTKVHSGLILPAALTDIYPHAQNLMICSITPV